MKKKHFSKFMIKTQQTRNRRVLSPSDKVYLQPTANIILNGYGFLGNSIYCKVVQIVINFVESSLATQSQLVLYLFALR